VATGLYVVELVAEVAVVAGDEHVPGEAQEGEGEQGSISRARSPRGLVSCAGRSRVHTPYGISSARKRKLCRDVYDARDDSTDGNDRVGGWQSSDERFPGRVFISTDPLPWR
jgi:hypothetical protein